MVVLGDIQWRQVSNDRWYGRPLAVARGLTIALPLLLVFGGLFMSADAAFDNLVRSLFTWDLFDLVSHLILIGWFAWVVGGLLRLVMLKRWSGPTGELPGRGSVGIIEIGIVLGLLDALFLAFVLVQSRYFFGGAATVATASLAS